MNASERTRIRSHPEGAVPYEASAMLAQDVVAHVGFIQDHQPFVIPLSYHCNAELPGYLYPHGSIKSRALRHLASGAPICITVTLSDGLVYSRETMNHSTNYRRAVLFGRAREVTSAEEKSDLFDRMVRRYFPGREVGQDYFTPPAEDLGVTALVEVALEEWNAKARRGGPPGPNDQDPESPGTAGILVIGQVWI